MTDFLSALVTAAALYGTVEVSDQSEMRVRNGSGLAGPVVDLETSPAVKIGVHSRRWEISTGYGPHLTLLQNGSGAQPEVVHRAWGSAVLHDRLTSISFYEDATYGNRTFTSLAPDPTIAPVSPQLERIPAAEIVHYMSSRTGCHAKISALRRWVLSALFEYALSGGLDAGSRAAIPFQTGPNGAISADYVASPGDWVSASLGVSRALFSSGEDDVLLQLTESWRHRFGRDTASTLGAGIGWAATRDGALNSFRSQTYPIVTAAITHRFRPTRVDGGLSLQLSPVVDRLSGIVGESFQGMATVTWSPTRALAVEGHLGASRTTQQTKAGALAFVLDEISVSYRLNELVALRGGTRSAWSSTPGGDAPPLLWVVFVGATISAPPVRF
jgi:hypothetical protein